MVVFYRMQAIPCKITMWQFPVFLFFILISPKISEQISDSEYLLMPAIFQLDNYDKCMLYENDTMYCMITFKLYPLNPKYPREAWTTIKALSSDTTNYRHDLLRHGVCIPDTCHNITKDIYKYDDKLKESVQKYYNRQYKELGLKGEVVEMRCETFESPYLSDKYDYFFVFLVVYFTIIICATLYEDTIDYSETHNKMTDSFLRKFVRAVSLKRNWQRLMTVDLITKDSQQLCCIQFIRVVILMITLLRYTFITYFSGPVSNPIYLEHRSKRFSFQFDADGGLYIQTLFVITGWLLTYRLFLDHENSPKVGFWYFGKQLFKKYLQMTPALAFVIAFISTKMVHLARGPLWDYYVGEDYKKCRKYWWANLFYINNFVSGDEMCLIQSWFLATDFQLYIVGLILVSFIWNNKENVWFILKTVLLIHLSYLFWMIYSNKWQYYLSSTPESLYKKEYLKLQEWPVYVVSGFSNLAGLVAGITYGYIYYGIRNEESPNKKINSAMCWIASSSAILGLAFIDYYYITDNQLFHAIYGSLRRSIFSFSVGLLILLMTQAQGSFMSVLCRSHIIYVLGRLSLSILLVHPVILHLQAGLNRSPSRLSIFVVVQPIRNMIMILVSAVSLALFVQMPIYELFKWGNTRKKSVKSH